MRYHKNETIAILAAILKKRQKSIGDTKYCDTLSRY